MKLDIAELRRLVQLKQLVEQGLINQALNMFFSMKNIWNKLSAIKGGQL